MNSMMADFIAILGWALINFIWQGLAIGMAAALLLAALRNARPQARYAVVCIALACCLLLPIAGIWRGLQADTVVPVLTHAMPVQSAAVPSPVAVTPLPIWHSAVQGRLSWVVIAWSLGAGLLALRMALGLAWVGRLNASAGAVDAQWQARLDRLACAMKIRHPVWLRLGDGIDGPIAAGWWRPVVLVPAALIARMPTELLEALLAHELAHVRRRDYVVNLLQCAVEALLFYHPVVWWLSRQIRIEREQIADDLALTAIGEPRRLALALQHLDLFQREETRLANAYFVPAANGGNLMMRIQRLLRPTRHLLTWNMALPILGLAAVCLAVNARENAVPAVAASSATVATIATAPIPATPATPAKPATPATPATDKPIKTKGTLRVGSRKEAHDSYAMVRENSDELMLSGHVDDIHAIKRARQHVRGDFLWFRRGATAYVVQDSSLLAKAAAAWQPTEAVGNKMEALEKQMRPHSAKMEALGKQMEAASERGEPISEEMDKIGKKMEPLGRQQAALGKKMEQLGRQMASSRNDDEREQLRRQMGALQAKMEVLSEQMESLGEIMERQGEQLERAHQPMEALGKQMEVAGKPMEALGDKMEVLGEQMDVLSKEADRKVKRLIDEAIRNGKAVRTDSISRL